MAQVIFKKRNSQVTEYDLADDCGLVTVYWSLQRRFSSVFKLTISPVIFDKFKGFSETELRFRNESRIFKFACISGDVNAYSFSCGVIEFGGFDCSSIGNFHQLESIAFQTTEMM